MKAEGMWEARLWSVQCFELRLELQRIVMVSDFILQRGKYWLWSDFRDIWAHLPEFICCLCYNKNKNKNKSKESSPSDSFFLKPQPGEIYFLNHLHSFLLFMSEKSCRASKRQAGFPKNITVVPTCLWPCFHVDGKRNFLSNV